MSRSALLLLCVSCAAADPTLTVVSMSTVPAPAPAPAPAPPSVVDTPVVEPSKQPGDECPEVDPDTACGAARRRLGGVNIEAVLMLESMEDQMWTHIPAQSLSPAKKMVMSYSDQERIVQKWFFDYMKVWECIQGAKSTTSECVEEQRNSMHMLMGGVINTKFWEACKSTATPAISLKIEQDKPLSVCEVKTIGQCCWAGINDKASQAKIVYELMDMKEATKCVNEQGGNVCSCSAFFNDGVVKALQGVVSAETQKEIFSHLQDHYC